MVYPFVDVLVLVLAVGVGMHTFGSELVEPKNILVCFALGALFVAAGPAYLWLWGAKDPLRYLEFGELTPGRGFILLGYTLLALALMGVLLSVVKTLRRLYRRWRRDGD